MDDSSQPCDQLHTISKRLTRFSSKHNADRCAPASRIHQLLALLSYSGNNNPARMRIFALVAWGLRSIYLTSSNRGSTSPLLVNRILVFPSLVLRGKRAIKRRQL
jgi:hypothetical protein